MGWRMAVFFSAIKHKVLERGFNACETVFWTILLRSPEATMDHQPAGCKICRNEISWSDLFTEYNQQVCIYHDFLHRFIGWLSIFSFCRQTLNFAASQKERLPNGYILLAMQNRSTCCAWDNHLASSNIFSIEETRLNKCMWLICDSEKGVSWINSPDTRMNQTKRILTAQPKTIHLRMNHKLNRPARWVFVSEMVGGSILCQRLYNLHEFQCGSGFVIIH